MTFVNADTGNEVREGIVLVASSHANRSEAVATRQIHLSSSNSFQRTSRFVLNTFSFESSRLFRKFFAVNEATLALPNFLSASLQATYATIVTLMRSNFAGFSFRLQQLVAWSRYQRHIVDEARRRCEEHRAFFFAKRKFFDRDSPFFVLVEIFLV